MSTAAAVELEPVANVETPPAPSPPKVVRLDANDYAAAHGSGGLGAKLDELTAAAPVTEPPGVQEMPGDRWPKPLGDEALHGLVGDAAKTILPHTEADPVALLLQLLVAFGNIIGRNAYWQVGGDRHFGNLYGVLVGATSRGRKGTAWGEVRRLFEPLPSDEDRWAETQVISGLSSGEGLIYQLRDQRGEDTGAADKRAFVLEPEFARVLRQGERQGNILSPVLRQGWDTGNLQNLTRQDPLRATGAHVSIVAHITKAELLRNLNETESCNGFGNRFLWTCVRRSKLLPNGGAVSAEALAALRGRLVEAVAFGKQAGLLVRDQEAEALWERAYAALAGDDAEHGMAGALCSRAEAQTMRVAMLYALLDGSLTIGAVHLRAALAVWRYCEESVTCIFGDATGDPMADAMMEALRRNPAGLTRTQLHGVLGGHAKSGQLDLALGVLLKAGRLRPQRTETGGRPEERYFAA